MNAFRPQGRTKFVVKVPTSEGWVNRPTGTRDPNTARKMQRMIDDLGPDELCAADVLNLVGDKTVTIPQLWALWQGEGTPTAKLKLIRATLADTDLLEKRKGWIVDTTLRSSAASALRYDAHLGALVASLGKHGGLPRSVLTVEALKGWLGALPQATGTKRKYHAGVSSFFGYCVSVGALERNPMADIDIPASGPARDRHLTAAEAQRLADAQPAPFREFSALLAGTGIEVGVALQLTVKDVDVTHQEIRARGTKTHNRDRVAKVASWAWPYVLRATQQKTPDAKLFDGITDGFEARKVHREACAALGIENYTQRDARHTYAVRMVRAGTPMIQVSKQLGHGDVTMVSLVYGLYEPSQAERAHWEAVATARDNSLTEDVK